MLTAGGSSLQYDAVADVYTYIWKTEKAWAGTYRQLVLGFADGTFERANFKFKLGEAHGPQTARASSMGCSSGIPAKR